MPSNEKMEGIETKHVEIFLKTPLFRFRYSAGSEERELMENAVRISGKVMRESSAGLLVKVDMISNMRQKENDLPFERIFLPFDKIDFIVID